MISAKLSSEILTAAGRKREAFAPEPASDWLHDGGGGCDLLGYFRLGSSLARVPADMREQIILMR